jgi:hypothetical protein
MLDRCTATSHASIPCASRLVWSAQLDRAMTTIAGQAGRMTG